MFCVVPNGIQNDKGLRIAERLCNAVLDVSNCKAHSVSATVSETGVSSGVSLHDQKYRYDHHMSPVWAQIEEI